MVGSLIELRKILLHYSRKRDFQSQPKQILLTTLRKRNTFLFKRLTMHHSTSTPFLTTRLQCLRWSIWGFQIYHGIMRSSTKLNLTMKQRTVSIFHQHLLLRNRNRKVFWFNPKYSQIVKINIGKLFIKLVRKHFLKILNLNTLKLYQQS